jgi:hypothetical protein
MDPPTSSSQRARTGPPSASTSRTGRGRPDPQQIGTLDDSAPTTGAMLSHYVGQDHETLLRTDQEARTKGRTGRDAHPCHEDRREPVRSRRSRAFNQDRGRSQAPRGLIPILMLLANSGCLTEVA